MITDCTALILAGGHSRRMGCDKTALQFDGQSLLQRMVDLMQTLFPAVLVSVRQIRADIDVAQVCDEIPDAGPLAGLCAGLARVETPWVFAVAADMPGLLPEVVEQLATCRKINQAVVPVINGFPQPLTAFYATSTLPALKAALARGERSVHASLIGLNVCRVDETSLRRTDAQLTSFNDLDTPEDVAAWRKMRSAGIQELDR
ncbi:putative molybdenum cofactor guanylyltransferase [Betaproteobacteria bacterium]|nr:putative molybdenum cofactor guanylyltransferase [Betaproteobacteria bacterium]GHU02549.1 putative molybdenum cofactor guanylyltransferase [Betaproteobacteria bacterium]GHU20017.1 putative molybdenum cofactor guanylyltransferase [Betaproteobacteria bacterium]